jgi:broad specificity phosphatase PhoE
MTLRIYLVRHGQSTHNANDDVPHNPDPPLTALGRRQAALTGQALYAADLRATALYASPMRRALETTRPLHESLDLPPHILPDLCEAGGLRDHAGLCREEILSEWAGATLDERITESGWWTPGRWEEEEAKVYARAAHAYAALRARHGKDDTLIIVTHGRFGSALTAVIVGLGPAGYSRFPFDNCGISRIDIDRHGTVAAYSPPPELIAAASGELEAARLRFHNQTTHLPPELVT